MILVVDEHITLTEFRGTDRLALVKHLQEYDIFLNTLRIPYPYTETDADSWLDLMAQHLEELENQLCFAIRIDDSALIGAAGFSDIDPFKPHAAEIGYWLAKPHWSQGITTKVVRKLCDYGFNKLNLVRITANIFEYNKASVRVVEKCGFTLEGRLKKAYKKKDHYIDGLLYALVKEDA